MPASLGWHNVSDCISEPGYGAGGVEREVGNSKNNPSVSLIISFGVSCQMAYHPTWSVDKYTARVWTGGGHKEAIILVMYTDKMMG